jgi:hypothetical protein
MKILEFMENNDEKYKSCSICGLAKKQNDFYNNENRCKPCKIKYNKERRHIKNEQLNRYKNIAEDSYKIKDKLIEIYENRINKLENEIKYINRKFNMDQIKI